MNKKKIRITKIENHGKNHDWFCDKVLMLRKARQVGDVEVVNHTVLSVLCRNYSVVEFEIIKD